MKHSGFQLIFFSVFSLISPLEGFAKATQTLSKHRYFNRKFDLHSAMISFAVSIWETHWLASMEYWLNTVRQE